VGDSVSQVNPVVGEGYKFIFESAIFASKAICQSLKNEDVNLLLNLSSINQKRQI
jgi:digeranylgeranylglycerophospholipid reductase